MFRKVFKKINHAKKNKKFQENLKKIQKNLKNFFLNFK